MIVGVKIDFLLLVVNVDREWSTDRRVESREGVAVAELFRLQDN